MIPVVMGYTGIRYHHVIPQTAVSITMVSITDVISFDTCAPLY